MSRHPGLKQAVRAAGDVVAFMTAYARLDRGWKLDAAVSTPVRPPKPKALRRIPVIVLPWERPGYIPARPSKSPKVLRRKRTNSATAEDTSPPHIRALRARYCERFIETGELDVTMLAELQRYANEHKANEEHSLRVSTEHAAHGQDRPNSGVGNDSGRSVMQIDGDKAGKIHGYLFPG